MSETEILQSIRVALAKLDGCTVFRNNSGKLPDAHGRWVTYGLGIGSADLVGIVRTLCRDCASGRFFALEVKRPGAKESPDQARWIKTVRQLGGFATIVHSVDEALSAVGRCRLGECE